MPVASRNRIYVLLIAILLLTNLALVAFFVFDGNEKPRQTQREMSPRMMMSDALKNEVGFNEQQLGDFEKLADQHRKDIRRMFEEITKSKERFYFNLTKDSVADTSLVIMADEIGRKQKSIDSAIFNYFHSIRQIATPEQKPRLDSVMQKIVRRMISPQRRGGGDKKQDSTRDKRH